MTPGGRIWRTARLLLICNEHADGKDEVIAMFSLSSAVRVEGYQRRLL